jgi:hypothetical protein
MTLWRDRIDRIGGYSARHGYVELTNRDAPIPEKERT